MGEMAGGEIPAHIQLGTDPVFGEGGEFPFAAIARITAQQIVLQQTALVGGVFRVIAVGTPGEAVGQYCVEVARLPGQLASLGALAALLVVLAHLPLAIGLGHFTRPLIPLGVVLEVVEFEAQQMMFVQLDARAGGGAEAIQIRRDAALVVVGGLMSLPAGEAQQVFGIPYPGGAGGAQLLLVTAAIVQHLAAEIGILALKVIFRLLGADDDGAADGIGAMEGGTGSLGHLYLFDIVEIEAEAAHLVVEVVGAKAVADPHPVLDDEHPVAAHAADDDVLGAAGGAGHRDAGFVLEHIGELGGNLAIQILLRDDGDGTRHVGELLLDALSLDHDGFAPLEFGGHVRCVDPGGIAGSQRRTGQQHGPVVKKSNFHI